MQVLIVDQAGAPTWRYDAQAFARAIRESHLSHTQIEDALGYSRGAVNKIHQRKTIGYEIAAKLARILDLDLVEWGI